MSCRQKGLQCSSSCRSIPLSLERFGAPCGCRRNRLSMRPFPTPLCLAGQQFASTRAVLRRVACHKSCKICMECPWQHLSLSGPKYGTRPDVLPARRHTYPNQPNTQSISTLDAAIVARGCREGADVQHICLYLSPFRLAHMQDLAGFHVVLSCSPPQLFSPWDPNTLFGVFLVNICKGNETVVRRTRSG